MTSYSLGFVLIMPVLGSIFGREDPEMLDVTHRFGGRLREAEGPPVARGSEDAPSAVGRGPEGQDRLRLPVVDCAGGAGHCGYRGGAADAFGSGRRVVGRRADL